MMSWLPIARDFRGDLRAALNSANPTDCLEKLASLAAYRLGFLETVQLDRAFGRLGLKEAPGFLPIRLAVLASSTVDHLSPAIRVAGLRRRLLIDVHSRSIRAIPARSSRSDFFPSSICPANHAVLAHRPGSDCRRSTHGDGRRSRRNDRKIHRRVTVALAKGARDLQCSNHSTNLHRRN